MLGSKSSRKRIPDVFQQVRKHGTAAVLAPSWCSVSARIPTLKSRSARDTRKYGSESIT